MANDDATLAAIIGKRIESIRKSHPERFTQTQCAEKIGVKQQMWSKWESGLNVPNTVYQMKIADLFGVTLDFLLGRTSVPGNAQAVADGKPEAYTVPILGLAACGVSGWFNPRQVAVLAPLPSGYGTADDLFAVIAIGQSMEPDGIRDGYLLYCKFAAEPQRNDAVFVKTKDGTATVKRFIGRDDEWLTLQGWLDPDKNGSQKPFTNKYANSYIESIACVVIVKRKA